MRQFNFEEELKKLPASPGVYLMHDENDTIIYVGKAVILKNRVRSYFRDSTKKTPKIQQMVKNINWFEYVVTDSELEALVLENNLIKEHQPKYNTMLKDDKTYPYIKVTVREKYPRVIMTRLIKKDGARYFGPYTAAGAVKEIIELMRKLYKIRVCRVGTEGPCLYYHIGQCSAPCIGKISTEEYKANIEQVLDFLNGNYKPLLGYLEDKMKDAAEEMEYEKAAEYRDLLNSAHQIAQKQKITDFSGDNRDIIAIASDSSSVIIQVFFIRDGKILGREHFYMKHTEDEDYGEIMKSFIWQYYGNSPAIPRELLLSCDIDERELTEEWLSNVRGGRVTIGVPQKGRKEKLVELAIKNAEMVLSKDIEKIKREQARTTGALREIRDLLGLGDLVRMEAFDISNISGFDSVGSMVVYENGSPKRNDYRKFRIKSVEGPNDYASMEEVLTRRFEHGLNEIANVGPEDEDIVKEHSKFGRFPDLLMMDGGRGQVNIAEAVLNKLGLNIPVCGMVKDDNHRTRGLYYHNEELPIDTSSEGFKLITRIQDEAHRFAIEYHRSLRSKGQVHSILDDIPGIGSKRRLALMRCFGDIEKLKVASVETLSEVPGMNKASADAVYKFFHNSGQPDR